MVISKINIIEKYPRIVLSSFVLLLIVITDFICTNTYIFIKENFPEKRQIHAGDVLGIRDSIFHHGFKKKSSFESYYSVYTNSLGFKDSSMRDIDLKTNSHRILFIGDSFTEGVMLNWEDTFVGMIANALNELEIEVLNAARASYSPSLYWKKIEFLIREKGLKFDELIVFMDISDLEDELKYRDFMGYANSREFKKKPVNIKNIKEDINSSAIDRMKVFLKNELFISYIFLDIFYDLLNIHKEGREISFLKINQPPYKKMNYFRSNWTLHLAESPPVGLHQAEDTEATWEENIKDGLELMTLNMDKIARLCNESNIDLTLAVYPHQGQIIYDDFNSFYVKFWKSYCIKNNIKFLNIFPAIFTSNTTNSDKRSIINNIYIKNDVHFNAYGNKIIADAFLDFYLKD